MGNESNIQQLNTYFKYLTEDFNFKLKDVKSSEISLYAKFSSDKVGIYFIYEFRDFAPSIQFTLLRSDDFDIRPGLYTLTDLYKEADFKLESFYLDEILSLKYKKNYMNFFSDVKTIEKAIEISTELVKLYAIDFVKGNNHSYEEMDKLYKMEV